MLKQLRVQGYIGPSPRDMTVLTDISSNNWFPIEMVAEATSEAEGGLEVPRVLARAEGALDIDLPSLLVADASPNPARFEVMEEPSEEHVVAPLIGVHAAGPVAEEQIIVAELSREKFASLFSPQMPIAAGQMRIPADVHPFRGVPVGGDAGVAEAGAANCELEEGGPGGGGIGGDER